ncbi:MAG: DUF72 domain-containing protein [Bryobacterales bacterium]|nr:DUF72 domain-containing protein [Bryobacterales bacterium]
MSTLPLFEDPVPDFAAALAPKLARLAEQGIYIGTSSWKYEGWLGQIYSRERYGYRGKFSQKKFENECLEEYAKTFPIVCGDFSFYQFPSEAYWAKLFASAPRELRFTFKVPEDITVKRFPKHDRYGPKAGLENAAFLNPALFQDGLLGPLERYRSRIAALILEFGSFAKGAFAAEPAFLDRLEQFLAALPATFRYAVEIRNPEFLEKHYFDCLRAHRVSHVFNAWTRMPELGVQMGLADAFTTDFTLVRALLRKGRAYEDAVAQFSPYERIQDPNPAGRVALQNLIVHARRTRQPSFLFVNNRFEGNAPQTIQAIVDDLPD